MKFWHSRIVSIAILAAVFAPLGLVTQAADAPRRVKLVVLVVFDQLRGDYPIRWHDCFGPDGFQRLEREGTWFTNCHYNYAGTQTGPGHASLSTGASPSVHGIVANEWFERQSGNFVHCTTHSRYSSVYTIPPVEKPKTTTIDKAKEKSKGSGCADRLLVPAFADALKQATGGRSRVVAMSLKERSAVLLGGHKPDDCYWFDTRTGTFCTSTYYHDRPAPWVNEFNEHREANQWFANMWDRLRPNLNYVEYSGPDDVPSEGTGVAKKQGRVFPHAMAAGLKQPGPDYYTTVMSSPFGNELLLDFAIHAIEAENLGGHDVPDFLGVSFPCNDLIGHVYGPDSQEVFDVTLRTDLVIRDLLAALDHKVGRGNYALALSADHGVCPLPELSLAHGIDAKRLDTKLIADDLTKHLNKVFAVNDDQSVWIEKQAFPWFYFNNRLVAARGLTLAQVCDAAAAWLRQQPWAVGAYTRRQLGETLPTSDVFGCMLQRSFRADRSGDVAVIIKPYYLPNAQRIGTGHNTPHPYDTHVPLFVLGPGLATGRSDERVTPQAAVTILAQAAGIPRPANAEAPMPKRLAAR